MFEQFNQQLAAVREKQRKQEKLKSSLSMAQENLKTEQTRLKALEQDLYKEDADVKKLEGLSLSGLFYSVLGSKNEQLDKERQEYLAAKLKFDKCEYTISSLQREIAYLTQQLAQFEDLDAQYKSILERKEKLISTAGDENARRLIQLSENLANVGADVRELKEAVNAGNEVLSNLNSLIDSLKSASSWGTWDMLGGGLLATAVKHSKIDQARETAHQTQQQLRRFQKELADVGPGSNLTVEIGSFETFADYFLDGLIFDWIVQTGINRSLDQAVQMHKQVQQTVKNLKNQLTQVKNNANILKEERQNLVEKL